MECAYHMDHLIIGELDSGGRVIEQVVYEQKDKYVIYFVEGDYLWPYYVDDYDFDAEFSSDFQQLLAEVRSINIKNCKKNEFVRQHIASAYYNAINKYEEVGIGELNYLKSKLCYKSYVQWILTFAICNLILIAISAFIFEFGNGLKANEILCCICASCIGSFLAYSKKQSGDFCSLYLPSIDAVITFMTSAISGLLVYCILKSNLLLGTFNENTFGIILVGFIAGFSEDIPIRLLGNVSNMVMGQSRNRGNR